MSTTLNDSRTGALQSWLVAQGHQIAVDGDGGPKTLAAFDRAFVSTNRRGSATSRTFGGIMADLAKKEVGVKETPKNSNRGPRVEEYQAATWLEGSGWPWCAAFVCWVVREAMAVKKPTGGWKRPRTAGAWDFLNWARKEGIPQIKRDAQIEPGDILVYTFSHIGVAVSPSSPGEAVTVVEGNTDGSGSREGGGVYRRTRKRDQIRGIIRLG